MRPIDVAHDLVELFLIDLRALLGLPVEGIADGAFARASIFSRTRRSTFPRRTGGNRRSSIGPG